MKGRESCIRRPWKRSCAIIFPAGPRTVTGFGVCSRSRCGGRNSGRSDDGPKRPDDQGFRKAMGALSRQRRLLCLRRILEGSLRPAPGRGRDPREARARYRERKRADRRNAPGCGSGTSHRHRAVGGFRTIAPEHASLERQDHLPEDEGGGDFRPQRRLLLLDRRAASYPRSRAGHRPGVRLPEAGREISGLGLRERRPPPFFIAPSAVAEADEPDARRRPGRPFPLFKFFPRRICFFVPASALAFPRIHGQGHHPLEPAEPFLGDLRPGSIPRMPGTTAAAESSNQ